VYCLLERDSRRTSKILPQYHIPHHSIFRDRDSFTYNSKSLSVTCTYKENKTVLALRWSSDNTGTARWHPKLIHLGFTLVCHSKQSSKHVLLLAHCSITSREQIAHRAFIEVTVEKGER